MKRLSREEAFNGQEGRARECSVSFSVLPAASTFPFRERIAFPQGNYEITIPPRNAFAWQCLRCLRLSATYLLSDRSIRRAVRISVRIPVDKNRSVMTVMIAQRNERSQRLFSELRKRSPLFRRRERERERKRSTRRHRPHVIRA